MGIVNVSLPNNLKSSADELVTQGYYSSFSDLVRTAIRDLLTSSKYDHWAQEAKDELREKKIKPLKTSKDISNLLDTL